MVVDGSTRYQEQHNTIVFHYVLHSHIAHHIRNVIRVHLVQIDIIQISLRQVKPAPRHHRGITLSLFSLLSLSSPPDTVSIMKEMSQMSATVDPSVSDPQFTQWHHPHITQDMLGRRNSHTRKETRLSNSRWKNSHTLTNITR